jgi:signal transduction histidine kinase
MHGILDRFSPIISHKGLKLKADLSSSKKFSGDKEALYTALKNMIDNATKFTPEDGHINVKMFQDEEYLHISVTNSFDKMAEDDLRKIFDPFHRAGRPTKGGSGLGLAITKKIIERHGGEIMARNSDDGLEIKVKLPSSASERASKG